MKSMITEKDLPLKWLIEARCMYRYYLIEMAADAEAMADEIETWEEFWPEYLKAELEAAAVDVDQVFISEGE